LQQFLYSLGQLDELEKTLSAERLRPYLSLAKGERQRAIKLYERNTSLSQSLYGVLQGLEVTVRNAFHSTLSKSLKDPKWYDSWQLAAPQLDQLRRAKSSLARESKPLDPGRIVAELSFGFWTGLTGPGYAALWNGHLVKAFPNRTLQRVTAHQRLDEIRKLRNRVAHHEPILSRPLQKDFNRILDTVAWICPVTSRWLRSNSDFPIVFVKPI
jgi:hypothetical protein